MNGSSGNFGSVNGTLVFGGDEPPESPQPDPLVDTEPPILSLIGDSIMIVYLGDEFIDPWVDAYDNFDGNMDTTYVSVDSYVNTDVPGTYILRYNIIDSSGNAAEPVSRTVVVEFMPNPDGAVLWSGADVYYEKDDYTDYTSNQDKLTDFVWLTRQDERGLYNSIYENSYDNYDNGPVGTKWAFGSLSDYASLEYASWRPLLVQVLLICLISQWLCICRGKHLFSTYFLKLDIKRQGGGYSYVRTSPDGLEPDPNSINEYSYSFGDFEANMMEESRWELVITSDKPWESDFLNQQRSD